MYPRAKAYIISVKQSTYCQFGEVIRAPSELEEQASGEGLLGGNQRTLKRLEEESSESVRMLDHFCVLF